jgi:hypothetical protein
MTTACSVDTGPGTFTTRCGGLTSDCATVDSRVLSPVVLNKAKYIRSKQGRRAGNPGSSRSESLLGMTSEAVAIAIL